MKTSVHLLRYRSVLLRMRNVLDKRCRENQNMHFVLNNFFFPRKSRSLRDCVGKI